MVFFNINLPIDFKTWYKGEKQAYLDVIAVFGSYYDHIIWLVKLYNLLMCHIHPL